VGEKEKGETEKGNKFLHRGKRLRKTPKKEPLGKYSPKARKNRPLADPKKYKIGSQKKVSRRKFREQVHRRDGGGMRGQ